MNNFIKKINAFIKKVEKKLQKVIDQKEKFFQKILKRFPSRLNADQLTLIRILCILPIIFFVLKGEKIVALGFFIFGGLLDLFDGPVARFQKKETDFGKIMDPISDKILFVGTFLILILNSDFPFLLFWLTVIGELALVFITLMGKNFIAYEGWRKRLGANIWGKWKFFLQFCAICLLLINYSFLAQIILWLATIFAFASIVLYLTPQDQ